MSEIIITGPFLKTGGVGQFINNLSPIFGNEIVIFRRGKRKTSGIFNFILPFVDVLRFTLFIKKIKPEKVIVNSSLANVGIFRDGLIIFISKTMGIKTILYIHGFNERALERTFLIKFGYFKADKIFVLSSKFKKQLFDLGYKNSIIVTYNPISQDLIHCEDSNMKELKNNNKINILMMSRIEKSKGIFIGLEAFENIQKFNVELNIAGTGTELENAKEFVEAKKIKNVNFHGFITGVEKRNLLKKSNILLFPTFHNEGLPINILEGLAMGLYVITRPVAGIKDLVHNYHLSLVDSIEAFNYEKIILDFLDSGIPKNEILENQLKARVDFSPKTIYDKVVINS